MPVLQSLIEYLAPAECLACQIEGDLICAACLEQSVINKRPTCYRCNRLSLGGKTCRSCRASTQLSGVSVASHYEGPIKELVAALKYQHHRSAAQLAARLITPLLDHKDFDIVTSAPTSPRRHRQRGYDQAELIAREVARQLQLPYLPTLTRLQDIHQVGSDRRHRLEQVKGIFVVTTKLYGERVLIIDDVLTTGATMAECAKELKAAGAKRVWGAVVAKH